MKRHPVLTVALVVTLSLAMLSTCFADRQIVLNTSPSVAPGLYLKSSAAPAVGSTVDFRIPSAARGYVQQRSGNDGNDWYILKPIAAGPGDRVDTTGSSLIINGRRIALMPPATDFAGRSLPLWREARVLGPGEFFVFSDRIANSFDSRCYGPVSRNQIAAVRRPLVTW